MDLILPYYSKMTADQIAMGLPVPEGSSHPADADRSSCVVVLSRGTTGPRISYGPPSDPTRHTLRLRPGIPWRLQLFSALRGPANPHGDPVRLPALALPGEEVTGEELRAAVQRLSDDMTQTEASFAAFRAMFDRLYPENG